MNKIFAFSDGEVLDKTAPDEVLILKKGPVEFTRNNKKGAFEVTDDDLDTIIGEFESRGKELVFDYGHASLNKEAGSVGDAPASGWCDKLKKTKDGLVAHIKNWSDKAKDLIVKNEYRYTSPVLFFDEKTQRPNSIHSVALTNSPAISNQAPLLAFSDFLEGENTPMDTPQEGNVAVSKFKQLATDIVGNIQEMKSELSDVLVSLEDLVETDEDKQELKAFADSLFEKDIQAFADEAGEATEVEPEAFSDITKEFVIVEKQKTPEQLIDWLKKQNELVKIKIQEAPEEKQVELYGDIAFIANALKQLGAEADTSIPQVEQKSTTAAILSQPQGQAFEDIVSLVKKNNPVAFEDTGDVKDENIIKEIESLYEFKANTMLALSDIGADSPQSIKNAIDKVNANALDVEANSFVQACISNPDCKITLAMQDWATDFYKKDKDGFKTFIANAPVAFSQSHPELSQPDTKAKVSATQERIARIFGNDPEEVYNH